jgi:hypothetical protein
MIYWGWFPKNLAIAVCRFKKMRLANFRLVRGVKPTPRRAAKSDPLAVAQALDFACRNVFVGGDSMFSVTSPELLMS